MRSRFVFLLHLFGLIAAVLADNEALKDSQLTTSDSSLTSFQHEDTTTLFEETTDLEERAGIPLTPDVMISNFIKSLIATIKNKAKAWYWFWTQQIAEDIYKRLQLDDKLENILVNPKFYAWVTYVDMLNKKNPNNKVSIVQLLTNTYGDLAVAKEIQRAVFDTKWKMAVRLLIEQRRNWIAAGKSADDIFTMLELDKLGSDIFVNLELITWYNYVVVIKRKGASTEIASVLLKHYSDTTLSKMFKEAKPIIRLMEYTMKLETAVGKFLKAKTSLAHEHFKALDLNTKVDDLLTSPNLRTFLEYLKVLNRKMPGRPITQIEIFTYFFGDRALACMLEAAKKVKDTETIARLYQAAQFNQWLRDGKTRQEIWKMFKLEKGTLTTNPDAEIWRGYNSYCQLHYKS
ncbi:hypothetical protein KXD40_006259 [Peronospora effusa]|nr:hypothetical protein KXD40_006259 [Peronospora effusa]CAI5717679.1 unnamed protein product [Peronospora effusa]